MFLEWEAVEDAVAVFFHAVAAAAAADEWSFGALQLCAAGVPAPGVAECGSSPGTPFAVPLLQEAVPAAGVGGEESDSQVHGDR